jgi:3-phosphoshikimate 1-carboxyvinyltransferase
MGCAVDVQGGTVQITGLGGVSPAADLDLFMGNAGTAMRPLTAALALMGTQARLHGVARMHERPIGDLVDALRQLGCDIGYTGQDGFPPLHLQGHNGLNFGCAHQSARRCVQPVFDGVAVGAAFGVDEQTS